MGAIRKCAPSLLPPRPTVSVAFLNDREMTSVNEAYTGREGSTDVLSFPLGEDEGSRSWCGEVLISLDRAYKQSKEKDVSLIQEVIRLLIHALVHLGGLDHYDKKGFKEMRRMEFQLLLKCL
jgi:probable rRNA maturation factor